MSADVSTITPGSRVTLSVTATPHREASVKTLVRLLSKDPSVVRRNDKLAHNRNANPVLKGRGGRLRAWSTRHPKVHLVDAAVGSSATFIAGYGDLRDIASVADYIAVSAA